MVTKIFLIAEKCPLGFSLCLVCQVWSQEEKTPKNQQEILKQKTGMQRLALPLGSWLTEIVFILAFPFKDSSWTLQSHVNSNIKTLKQRFISFFSCSHFCRCQSYSFHSDCDVDHRLLGKALLSATVAFLYLPHIGT